MRLHVLPDRLAICRLDPAELIPDWVFAGPFISITRTDNELSLICRQSAVPDGVKAVSGWRGLRVEGVLEFSLVGILASLAQPLAAAGVSIFAVSTFDTDYVLVQDRDLPKSIEALAAAGHEIILAGA